MLQEQNTVQVEIHMKAEYYKRIATCLTAMTDLKEQ